MDSNDETKVTTGRAIEILARRYYGGRRFGARNALRGLVNCAREGLMAPFGIYVEEVTTADRSLGFHGSYDEPDMIPRYFWHHGHYLIKDGMDASGRSAGIWYDRTLDYFQRWHGVTWDELPYRWQVRWTDTAQSEHFQFDARASKLRWDLLPLESIDLRHLESLRRSEAPEYRHRATVNRWQDGLMELLAFVLETGKMPGDGSKSAAVAFLRGRVQADDRELYAAMRILDRYRHFFAEQGEIEAPID